MVIGVRFNGSLGISKAAIEGHQMKPGYSTETLRSLAVRTTFLLKDGTSRETEKERL